MPNNTRRNKKNVFRTLRNKFPGARNLFRNENPTQKAMWNLRVKQRQIRKSPYYAINNLTNNNLKNLRIINTSGPEWNLNQGNNNKYEVVPFNLASSQYSSEEKKILAIKPNGYTNSQWLEEFKSM